MSSDLIDYIKVMELVDCRCITKEALKQKYRILTKKYHPDTSKPEYKDGKKMRAVNEANDFLSEMVKVKGQIINPLYLTVTDDNKAKNNSLNREQHKTASSSNRENRGSTNNEWWKPDQKPEYVYEYKKLKWIEVSSSCIKSIAYDSIHNCLFVIFINTGLYYFLDVPEYLYEGLLTASSKGKYFNAKINYKYKYGTL